MTEYYRPNEPDDLTYKRFLSLRHQWGNSVSFVSKFKLYADKLKIPEIFQIHYLEDKVQPEIRNKLIDILPYDRKIERLFQTLIYYDCNRERIWGKEMKKENKNKNKNKNRYNNQNRKNKNKRKKIKL